MSSRSGGASSPPKAGDGDERLRRALEELAAAARERLDRKAIGWNRNGGSPRLPLRLAVPLGPVGEDLVAQTRAALEREIDSFLDHQAVFLPGRVFCLRCGQADCEHSRPTEARQVFAGFGPSGLPRFLDFGQWLLERQHPQVDRLYAEPPRLVTDFATGKELHSELLPAFRDRKTGFRLEGQVTAGWFRVPMRDRRPAMIALTFQVLSSAPKAKKGKGRYRRLGMNVLGQGPEGEALGDLYDRLDDLPWKPAQQWGQEALDTLDRAQGPGAGTWQEVSQRIDGILNGMARRLQQARRSRDRRTEHAQDRHKTGERPTRMALKDLAAARDESFLFDRRRKTVVVLGQRGRAHVWSLEGKLVTSIRYSGDSIERKKKLEIWRPARLEEIVALRKVVGVEADAPVDAARPVR